MQPVIKKLKPISRPSVRAVIMLLDDAFYVPPSGG
jgi:hypothetical protein